MLKLRDIMTRDVFVVSGDMTLRRALELFAQRHITGAPVVEGKQVVGVVSASDLLNFVADTRDEAEGEHDAKRPDTWDERTEAEDRGLTDMEDEDEPGGTYFTELWSAPGPDAEAQLEEGPSGVHDVLEAHTVEEAMTREVCHLNPEATVTAAADYMRRAGVHRILVLRAGELEGIVTTMDITRAVADRKLTARTYVFGAGTTA